MSVLHPQYAYKKNANERQVITDRQPKSNFVGQLNGRSVIINGKDATAAHLWNCGCFGRPMFVAENSNEPSSSLVVLFLEEALYLVVVSGCLSIANGDQLMTSGEFFSRCIASAADFVFRFAVYLHFRRRGWIVKPGLNYGVDYVVYPDAPNNVHSQFMVIIVPHWNGFHELPMTWRDAVSASRISCAVSKNVLLCGVKNLDGDFEKLTLDDLEQCLVQIVCLKQWFARRPFSDKKERIVSPTLSD